MFGKYEKPRKTYCECDECGRKIGSNTPAARVGSETICTLCLERWAMRDGLCSLLEWAGAEIGDGDDFCDWSDTDEAEDREADCEVDERICARYFND